jgi:uncharacterized protein YndB with AHSA1/START domain
MNYVFHSSRKFPYSPEDIFAAIENPALLAKWWGPDGFTNIFEVFEFRPGGRWKFVMHGPQGTHHPNENIFLEILRLEKVVIRHDCAPFFTLTIQLEQVPEGTLLDWQQDFDDSQIAHSIAHIIEPSNEQNLNRLENVLREANNR